MVETDARSIAAIRRQLVDALPVLDSLKYSIAAAHIALAIDVLDRELALTDRSVTGATAASFATAMEGEFGGRAFDVAEAQAAAATGDVKAVWVEIVSCLRG